MNSPNSKQSPSAYHCALMKKRISVPNKSGEDSSESIFRSNSMRLTQNSPSHKRSQGSITKAVATTTPATRQLKGRFLATKDLPLKVLSSQATPANRILNNSLPGCAASPKANLSQSKRNAIRNVSFCQAEPSEELPDDKKRTNTEYIMTEPAESVLLTNNSISLSSQMMSISHDFNQEEAIQRKDQPQDFVQKLMQARNQSIEFTQLLKMKETEIRNHYSAQIEAVNYTFMMIEQFLNDEKNLVLAKLNKQMSQTLETIESCKADITQRTVSLENTFNDMQSKLGNMVRKIQAPVFQEIIKEYQDLVESTKSRIKTISVQKIDIFQACEDGEVIKTLKRDMSNIINLSVTQKLILNGNAPQESAGSTKQSEAFKPSFNEIPDNFRKKNIPVEGSKVTPLGERVNGMNSATTLHRKKLSEPNPTKFVENQLLRRSNEIDRKYSCENHSMSSLGRKNNNFILEKENFSTDEVKDISPMRMTHYQTQPKLTRANELDSSLLLGTGVSPRRIDFQGNGKEKASTPVSSKVGELSIQCSPDPKSQKDIYYLYVENKLLSSKNSDKSSGKLRNLLINQNSPKSLPILDSSIGCRTFGEV